MPCEALAEAIADEWAEQDEVIDASSMPNMQLASTAIDRVRPDTGSVMDTVLAYAGTDLLCYRADEPATLQAQQWESWQPLVEWAEKRYEAPLKVTDGVMPVAQSPESVECFRGVLSKMDVFGLSGLANLTQACGSLVLALAVLEEEIDADQCIVACQLDERHQIARWGEDEELTARLNRQADDIRNAARFLALVKT